MPADVHHLDDVVFASCRIETICIRRFSIVAQIHIGDSGASGGVTRHAFEARKDDAERIKLNPLYISDIYHILYRESKNATNIS